MARFRVLAATAAIVAIAAPITEASAGPRASLRVETATRTVLGADAPLYGAARAYVDTANAPHALVPNTVLGQLVVGTGAAGVGLDVSFNDQFGGFVAGIGGAAAPATGFWALYVDNVASATGAETTVLKKGSEVVWVLDPDFNKAGPYFLDLDVDAISKVLGGATTVHFSVTRAGGDKPTAIKGATITVAGQKLKTNAKGTASVSIDRGTEWTARATLAGNIGSERLSGKAT